MVVIRPWQNTDLDDLVVNANNIRVWNNMRNYFPHPYSISDGTDWIQRSMIMRPATALCIDFNGQAVGGMGIVLQGDVHCKCAEIGYWLGEPFWGRGFGSEAVKLMTEYSFAHFDIVRLYAEVFETNQASCRVLEKSGYLLESVKKKAIFKNGVVMDAMVYVRLRE